MQASVRPSSRFQRIASTRSGLFTKKNTFNFNKWEKGAFYHFKLEVSKEEVHVQVKKLFPTCFIAISVQNNFKNVILSPINDSKVLFFL